MFSVIWKAFYNLLFNIRLDYYIYLHYIYYYKNMKSLSRLVLLVYRRLVASINSSCVRMV